LWIRKEAILNDESGLIKSAEASGNGRGADQTDRFDAGNPADAVKHLGLGADDGLVALVAIIFRADQGEIYLIQILHIEAGINVPRPHEALQDKAGSHSEDESKADL
jgi:hypothetical protein